jgi:hypothetical protein
MPADDDTPVREHGPARPRLRAVATAPAVCDAPPPERGMECEVCDHAVLLREVRASLLSGGTFLSCIACADQVAEPSAVVEDVVRLAGNATPLLAADCLAVTVWVPCARCSGESCERCDGGGRYVPAAERYSSLRLAHVVLGRRAVADRRD